LPDMDFDEAMGIAAYVAGNPHHPSDTSIAARQDMVTTLLYGRAATAQKAMAELREVLELPPHATWDDIVARVAEARDAARGEDPSVCHRDYHPLKEGE
jgi:hypothetical protein